MCQVHRPRDWWAPGCEKSGPELPLRPFCRNSGSPATILRACQDQWVDEQRICGLILGVDGQCEAKTFLNPHRTMFLFYFRGLCFLSTLQKTTDGVIAVSSLQKLLTASPPWFHTRLISAKTHTHTCGFFWLLLNQSNPVSRAPKLRIHSSV